MSWKGLTKAINRLPHLVRQKAGSAEETRDADFDVLARNYEVSSCGTERLLSDMKKYVEGVKRMLEHQRELINCFKDVLTGHDAIYGLPKFEATRAEVLELCERDLSGKIVYILSELVVIQKAITAKITKRAHKLLDYDRHLHALKKFEQINERSIAEERKMAQAEKALEKAQEEYEKYNEQLKRDLPKYFDLEARLMEPILDTLIAFQKTLYAKQREAHSFMIRNGPAASPQEYKAILSGYESSVKEALSKLNEMSLLQAATGRVKKSGLEAAVARSRTPSTVSDRTVRASGPLSVSSPREVPLRTVSPAIEGKEREAQRPDPAPQGRPSWLSPEKSSYSPPSPTMVRSPSGSRVAELAARLDSMQMSGTFPSSRTTNTRPERQPVSTGTAADLSATMPNPPPPPTLPPKRLVVQAMYDFVGNEAGDLSFRAGDLIEVISRSESIEDWWTGKLNDRTGIFPANYCLARSPQ